MKIISSYLIFIFLLFALSFGCSSSQDEVDVVSTDNIISRPDLGQIVGGILCSNRTIEVELFSSTISALIEGNKDLYSGGVDVLNSLIQPKDINDVVVKGNRESRSLYRGIYLNDIRDMRWALSHIDEVKLVGIDTILFEVQYGVDLNNEVCVPGEEVYLFYLNAFQKSGFRIWLTLGHTSYEFPYRYNSKDHIALANQSDLLGMFESQINRWAIIAEIYNVDTFIPSEEANTALVEQGEGSSLCQPKRDILNNWMQEILPEIQAVFSGNIGFATNDSGPCERLGTPDTRLGPDFDYRGYDFILYKLPFPSVFESDDGWEELVNYAIPHTLTFIERDGLNGLILYETGDTIGEPLNVDFAGNLPVRISDEQHQKSIYEKDFQILDNNEEIVGMFFKLSDKQPHEPSWNPFGNLAEEVIRENWTRYDTLPVVDSDELWVAIGEEGLKAIQVCISDEMPFDPEYSLSEHEYNEFISTVRSLCSCLE